MGVDVGGRGRARGGNGGGGWGGGISVLTEAKQKGTVHRSVPQGLEYKYLQIVQNDPTIYSER